MQYSYANKNSWVKRFNKIFDSCSALAPLHFSKREWWVKKKEFKTDCIMAEWMDQALNKISPLSGCFPSAHGMCSDESTSKQEYHHNKDFISSAVWRCVCVFNLSHGLWCAFGVMSSQQIVCGLYGDTWVKLHHNKEFIDLLHSLTFL